MAVIADSLVIAGAIELLGGGSGVVSNLPLCAGATFTLSPGFDLGAPQPVVDIVESLILNGERPYGTRASNRTTKLPVAITAPDRQTLAGARETLLELIDQQTWTMTWTRDGGLPLVLDCFRAMPSVPAYDLIDAQQFSDGIEITFQALPYGRSDAAVQLTFASPLSGTSAPPPPVTLDSFSSVSGSGWTQSTQCVTGPHSAEWNGTTSGGGKYGEGGSDGYCSYSKTFSAQDITGLLSIGFWFGAGSAYYEFTSFPPFTFALTLTDGSGDTLSLGTTQSATVSDSESAPAWTYITASIPQGSASFTYSDVTGYSIRVWNATDGELDNVTAYLDHIAAIPVSAASASARGTIYTLTSVSGTAPAPLSLQFQQPASGTFKTLVTHRPGISAPAGLSPLVEVGGGSDTPNGATQYTVPSPQAGVNAQFNGTYSVMLAASSWSSPSSSRTVTVTAYQYEYSSGPYATASVSRTFTPSADVTNGMVVLGELTLPVSDIAPDNANAYFALGVTDTNTSDRFYDCLLLDTQGQTCWINLPSSTYNIFYIDEPAIDRDLGRVMGSSGGRPQAVSVLANSFVSGGPLTVDPGTNALLAYCLEGTPNLVAYVYPRWFLDRLS